MATKLTVCTYFLCKQYKECIALVEILIFPIYFECSVGVLVISFLRRFNLETRMVKKCQIKKF